MIMNEKLYGLYVHIPFCRKKCNYCDFYSIEYDEEVANQFLVALEEEILQFYKKYKLYNNISTLYIGGGTPSVLVPKQLAHLFHILNKHFDFSYLKEVTVEVNPESVDEEKICIIKSFFNDKNLRLSLGVQSFNDNILEILGRCHKSKDVYKTIEIFNKLKIKNYNLDLIFGCPTQQIKDVKYDICQAILCSPTHVSCYALTIEEGTPFFQKGVKIDPDLQAQMYELIVELLQENMYYRYEISNFSKNGYECLHNLNYWRYKEYLGFGPSSVAFFDKCRIKNVSSVKEYVNKRFCYNEELIDEETALKEQIMLALRTEEGLQLTNVILQKYGEQIKELVNTKKLVKENDRIKISSPYKFLSNQIIVEFM